MNNQCERDSSGIVCLAFGPIKQFVNNMKIFYPSTLSAIIVFSLSACDPASNGSPHAHPDSDSLSKSAQEALETWLSENVTAGEKGIQITYSGRHLGDRASLVFQHSKAAVSEPQTFAVAHGDKVEFIDFKWNAKSINLTPDLTLNNISEAYVINFSATAARVKRMNTETLSEWYHFGSFPPMTSIRLLRKDGKDGKDGHWIQDTYSIEDGFPSLSFESRLSNVNKWNWIE